jgi:hypothetical protein
LPLRRLPRLPLRWLPSLPRLWRRLRLRRCLRILLRILGHLPPLLSRRPLCRHDRRTNIEMAGSDKVDPAVPCLLWWRLLSGPQAVDLSASRHGDDDFPGFQSFQKMLARELGLDVLAAMGMARGGASE